MQRRTKRPGIVLLVEDDPGDQILARRALEVDGARVRLEVASDGEAAMNYLLRQNGYAAPVDAPRPDLILLDLNLPGLNGMQVLERIRTHEDLRDIPVVILTTSDRDRDVFQCHALGCNSYVVKRTELDAFIRTMQALESYWFGLVTLPSEVNG